MNSNDMNISSTNNNTISVNSSKCVSQNTTTAACLVSHNENTNPNPVIMNANMVKGATPF